MNGFNGKILRVDLTSRSYWVETPSADVYRQFGGGRGMIIRTLLTEMAAGADPLGPENRLVFAPGILTGNLLPGSGRNSIGAKSPLTGGFGEAEAGGFWGVELKRAGYDAVIVQGTSPAPVYLWIDDGAVEIRDARFLWGLEIPDADLVLKKTLGDKKIRTALIGPGGEQLVLYACIANDVSHFAGRTGLGAVMGSKRLKAIAVRGSRAPSAADPGKIVELARWMGKNFREKASGHHRIGTGSTMVGYEQSGNLPVRNFKGGHFPEVAEIAPQKLFEKGYVKKRETCFVCPIRCKRAVGLDAPWTVDVRCGGPEYETLAALGSNCGVGNIEALMKANEICARHGIDTISTGVCVSFAMECYEAGLITSSDADGLELAFGNAEAMVTLVERIARREGLGNLLAEGTKRAAERIGGNAADYAIHVKGLELPMHEPRYKQGMGLHYSVHAAGADHCCGIQDDQVVKAMPKGAGLNDDGTLTSTEMSPRKARLLYENGLGRHLANHVGLCVFVPWNTRQVVEAVEAATGWSDAAQQLPAIAKRGLALARIFNLREGFSPKDDTLPRRFFETAPDGPLKNTSVDPGRMDEARQTYYAMLGWDAEGIPTRETLQELGLDWACDLLRKV